jgi:hypothetical protein
MLRSASSGRCRLRSHRSTRQACTIALCGFALAACSTSADAARNSSNSRPTSPERAESTAPTTPNSDASTSANHRMFAFYYLWWDTQHWHARLGPSYPYSANPLPLPATLTGDGCTVKNNFSGNQLTDVASPLFTQDSPAQIRHDVQLAAASGLAGFAVAWAGTGQPHQTATSSAFNRRLAVLVSAVDQIRKTGSSFSLWIAYMSSAKIRTDAQINNDLSYILANYGNNMAFDHSNDGKPTLIMMGSRKYPVSVLNEFSTRWRPHFYLVGDENWNTWNAQKAADFDADQYYWSSQNPIRNRASFGDIDRLAAEVRSTKNPDGSAKQFFAPLAPGYNKVLGGGSGCVPRLGGTTMKDLYGGNSSAHPNGWMVISWNEIDEGTYVMPLERYGNQSLITLQSIIEGASGSGGAS